MSISKKNSRTPAFIIALFVPLLVAYLATCAQAADTRASAPYKDKKLSPEELQKVKQNHAEWLKEYQGRFDSDEAQKDKRRANLSGANLSDARSLSKNLLYASRLRESVWSCLRQARSSIRCSR
jgi:uncharacterized protein YjbI with pentapeptide repeats